MRTCICTCICIVRLDPERRAEQQNGRVDVGPHPLLTCRLTAQPHPRPYLDLNMLSPATCAASATPSPPVASSRAGREGMTLQHITYVADDIGRIA